MFDARALQTRYEFMDGCPQALVDELITLPSGRLDERVAAMATWRHTLLAGRLPDPTEGWPAAQVQHPILDALHQLGIARFCCDQPELVDALLMEVIDAVKRHEELASAELGRRLRELEELERQTRVEAAKSKRKKRQARTLDPETLRRLREQAERELREAEFEPDADLIATWDPRVRVWAEIADVFGDLGEMLGRGWDLSTGVLKHTGWLEVAKLRKLIEQLDSLRAIVRALGRLHATSDGESVAESLFRPVQRLEEELLEIRTPLAPTETRGVERSGSIVRMLPVEAAMLGHPTLRKLWHARRAERALLSYRVEGVLTERVETERQVMEQHEGQRPRPERGPIMAIVDTSGSMHGLPEQVAKAVVLEALRTAHDEGRRCFLYAYSGPGQVLEHELDLSPDGLGRLLTFLGFSFHGGNDEVGVLTQVLARLKAEEWERSDVLFVSDGEWPAPSAVVSEVEAARERGTRFHGVQIANRGRTGLYAVCDPVHEFRDWAALAGWAD